MRAGRSAANPGPANTSAELASNNVRIRAPMSEEASRRTHHSRAAADVLYYLSNSGEPKINRSSSIAIGLNLQQRKRAEHAWGVGGGCRMQTGFVELGKRRHAQQSQGADHLVLQQFQHAVHAGFARR